MLAARLARVYGLPFSDVWTMEKRNREVLLDGLTETTEGGDGDE